MAQKINDESGKADDNGLPLKPTRLVQFEVNEGTNISLDVSPDGRTIVFDLLGDLYSMPIAGGMATRLTEGSAFDEQPRYSAGGGSIIFSSDRSGVTRLWRVAANSSNTSELLPPADTTGYRVALEVSRAGYFWSDSGLAVTSPDGRYTIRSSRNVYNVLRQRRETYVRTAPCKDISLAHLLLTDNQTGHQSPLTPVGYDCVVGGLPQSAFTPDSKAFITSFEGKIWRVEIPSGKTSLIPFTAKVRQHIRPLVRFTHRVSDDSLIAVRRITWARPSPDGTRLVFSALDQLWIMPLPNGKPRRLTTLDTGEFYPVWSPDGRYVAFVTWTDRGQGDGAIYRVPSDGRALPERLTREPGFYSHLQYTPDGTKLIAIVRPIRSLHRVPSQIDADMSDTGAGDAELVWLNAEGGVANPIAVLPPAPHSLAGNSVWVYGALHFVTSDSGYVLRYQVANKPAPYGESIGGVLVKWQLRIPRDLFSSKKDTVLTVDFPPSYTNLWSSNKGNASERRKLMEVLLSPTKDRALLILDFRDMYLVDVPSIDQGKPLIVFDPTSSHFRHVTTLSSGSEFPIWHPSGKSFVYSFGTTVYFYDIKRADSLIHHNLVYTPDSVSVSLAVPLDRPAGTVVLSGGRLITMRGNEIIEHGDIVIVNRRIQSIGARGIINVPPDARVIDIRGKTVVPGLVDLHNHVFPLEGIHRSRVWEYEADLAYGVLLSRDVQANSTDFLTYEDRLSTGFLMGPRYMNTGPGIPEPSADLIRSLDNARAVIARYADVYHIRYLKEYLSQWRDTRQWIVMAAAERGLNVTSHGSQSLKQVVMNAIDGYGGIEHSFHAAPLYDDVRRLLARTGITLAHSNWGDYSNYFSTMFDNVEISKLRYWYPPPFFERIRAEGSLRPGSPRRSDYFAWKMDSTLATLVASGGRVAVAAHGDIPGIGTHFEMWAFAEGGMPPLEVLRAGTLRGAEALGLDTDLGSLEVGKLADLLVLDRNPLEDIRNTTRIRYVLFNGRLYDAGSLNELWPRRVQRDPPWWISP